MRVIPRPLLRVAQHLREAASGEPPGLAYLCFSNKRRARAGAVILICTHRVGILDLLEDGGCFRVVKVFIWVPFLHR